MLVVASQIELDDISGRVLFPSPVQGPWLPFLRFAETTSAGGGDDPEGHSHKDEEVLNYVLEGRVEYEDADGHSSVLEPGTVELLTAHGETRHRVKGLSPAARTRWLSVVAKALSGSVGPTHRTQVAPGPRPSRRENEVRERPLLGPGTPVVSASGLECVDIEFLEKGECSCPIGPDCRAVAYIVAGTASVDGMTAKMGSGALIDNVTSVSIEGDGGARVLLASAPHWNV